MRSPHVMLNSAGCSSLQDASGPHRGANSATLWRRRRLSRADRCTKSIDLVEICFSRPLSAHRGLHPLHPAAGAGKRVARRPPPPSRPSHWPTAMTSNLGFRQLAPGEAPETELALVAMLSEVGGRRHLLWTFAAGARPIYVRHWAWAAAATRAATRRRNRPLPLLCPPGAGGRGDGPVLCAAQPRGGAAAVGGDAAPGAGGGRACVHRFPAVLPVGPHHSGGDAALARGPGEAALLLHSAAEECNCRLRTWCAAGLLFVGRCWAVVGPVGSNPAMRAAITTAATRKPTARPCSWSFPAVRLALVQRAAAARQNSADGEVAVSWARPSASASRLYSLARLCGSSLPACPAQTTADQAQAPCLPNPRSALREALIALDKQKAAFADSHGPFLYLAAIGTQVGSAASHNANQFDFVLMLPGACAAPGMKPFSVSVLHKLPARGSRDAADAPCSVLQHALFVR